MLLLARAHVLASASHFRTSICVVLRSHPGLGSVRTPAMVRVLPQIGVNSEPIGTRLFPFSHKAQTLLEGEHQ